MDTATANVIENLTEGKVDRTKGINDNMDIEKRSMNEEQDRVIKDLEDVLSFLKGVQILNEEALINIRKPLNDLQTSLKYLPIESSFDALPSEIKTHILSYLCDLGAFTVASVCQEWKEIVKHRFSQRQDVDSDVKVGKHCSNHQCEDDSCFVPAEILKAAMTHKLDIPLTICHSIEEIDSKVVADGLLSVSNLIIKGDCDCQFKKDDHCDCVDYDDNEMKPILSEDQIEAIIEGLDKRVKALEKVELIQVDMSFVHQDKLVNCLLSKVKWLTLDEGPHVYDKGFPVDFGIFVDNLKQITSEINLKHLTLHNFPFMDDWIDDELEDLADALCKVETVELSRAFTLQSETLERLIENILLRPIILNSLLINARVNFCALISPEDLRTLINKMERLMLWGFFTVEQLQVAETLHDVRVLGKPPCVTLKKG